MNRTPWTAIVLLLATADVGLAQRQVGISQRQIGSAQRKAPVQEFCPVFTSEKVSILRSPSVRYKGIKVRLSSREAYIRWLHDPDAYLDTKILPQLEGLNLPEREMPQEYCPVYPDRKVSGRDPFVWYEGKKIYVFSKGAALLWNRNPEKYVDLDILPQLRKPPTGDETEEGSDQQVAGQ